MSKYRGSATMVDEPTLQKPEGPPLDARVETRMIESDTLERLTNSRSGCSLRDHLQTQA